VQESAYPQPVDRIQWIDHVADLLDNRFRIPWTNIRFGIDFIIGLIPFIGDLLSFGISGLLLLSMVRYGASGKVIFLMVWNILLDTLIGGIPVLGDIFDLKYKANRRNFELFRDYLNEGKHQGSAWKWMLFLFLALIALVGLLIYGLWVMADLFWELLRYLLL
jgi:hypothetical protein